MNNTINLTLNQETIQRAQQNSIPCSLSLLSKQKSNPLCSLIRTLPTTSQPRQKKTKAQKMAPKPHPTSPLLFPFQKHRTTLYTPTNTPLPCTIEPTSSRSFITFSTLETYFPPLHLQLTDFYTPLPSVISPSIYNPIIKEEGGGGVAKVKVLKRVK